jgi:glycerol-3-phosphate acyltransferase PlsY
VSYIFPLILIVIAYLCGSIPIGYLVARLYGVDVTASGSGRTGGTNVLRVAGPLAAGLTVIGDVMKGMIPVYLMIAVGTSPLIVALAGTAAVIGHNHSIFLGFRGGAGAGTAIGALGGINFWAGLIAAILAVIALALTGYASVLTTTIAVSGLLLLILFAVLGYIAYGYILFGVLTLAVIAFALRGNYARLMSGTERKIGRKPNNAAEA